MLSPQLTLGRFALKRSSLLVAAIGTTVAVTAFGVAPLSFDTLPSEQRVLDRFPIVGPSEEIIGEPLFRQTERARRGDTLWTLLGRMGGNDTQFQEFVRTDRLARQALRVEAGSTILADLDEAGQIHRFVYRDLDSDRRASRALVIERRTDGRFVASTGSEPIERELTVRNLEIRSTLFAAADAAAVPDSVIAQIVDVFDDPDFVKGLRKGDRLRLVYESVRPAGSLDLATPGRIVAIEVQSRGKPRQAVWHERGPHAGEYYDFGGRSLKKSFLANPLEFTRVSSGFTESRFHPIMRDWRTHKGVDYAAPIGTKVRSVGDGVIEFIGTQRGYGRVIEIRHRNGISTLYAHLNDFADKLAVGSKVSQGEVIGEVGRTGWATGPHLHYEFKVNGEQADPLTASLPDRPPLDDSERARLIDYASALQLRMNQSESIATARFE